ncbi:MAG TPA: NDP-sugar synthase [Candidatus Dormibacteraeota bacterium]|nr:NDP-sugar synthase [Candidatus Dormibacteraeota bacterium]
MQAIVLVGGEGTRLRPLTYSVPKPMVPLLGRPFMEHLLLRLRDAGITEVVLPACYLPEAIERHFGSGEKLGMRLHYVIEDEPLGTAGALKNVERFITGPFFVFNGDILTSLDLEAMMAFHRRRGGIGTLHLIPVEDPTAFGCVERDAEGRITRFVEKPKPEEVTTNYVNAGTYLLEREVLDRIPGGRNVSIERETFPQLIAGERALDAYATEDYWIDIGKPENYLKANLDILRGTMPLRTVGPSHAVLVKLPSFAGAGTHVDPRADVGPDVVLGRACRVAAGARIRESVLWDGVIVDEGASIEGAIIAGSVHVGAGARVERGAVIGHGEVVAPGSSVAAGARIPTSA